MSHASLARRVFDIESAALRAVKDSIDGAFDRAVDLVCATLSARRKLLVLGIGKSGNIGRKIAATLTSTGSTAVVLDPVDALHGDLGLVQDGDTVLALSYSGESSEWNDLLPALRRFSVRIIAFTGNPRSTLGRHSEVVLDVRVPREACPFNLAPTASTTATLVMGDALAIAVMTARGFKTQDFAKRHPAGAIGRALLYKVGDIMRRDQRNAVARQDQSVQDGLLTMTRAKTGSVSVVDGRGRLVGVFTDGDLRRRLAAQEDILQRPLGEVMTRDPVTLREDALAVDALRIFNERNIDDLIVVDARRRPVGLVDSQDLPKLKLM